MPAASQRVLFISGESPPFGFVKINFDSNMKDGMDGAGIVIHDPNARLLVARDSHLFELSIPKIELLLLEQILFA